METSAGSWKQKGGKIAIPYETNSSEDVDGLFTPTKTILYIFFASEPDLVIPQGLIISLK